MIFKGVIQLLTWIVNIASFVILWSIWKKDDSGNRPIDVYLRMLYKD